MRKIISNPGGVQTNLQARDAAGEDGEIQIVSMQSVGLLGSHRLNAVSGLTTGIAANTPIFSFRWGSATKFALIKYLKIQATVITGFTAAQELALNAFIARVFTASDSAGTAIVFTTNFQKKRTSMATSLVTDCRVSGTAQLTVGTRTLDAVPTLSSSVKTLAAGAAVQDARMEAELILSNPTDYPTVLAQDEGIVVNNVILQGAAGTVRYGVTIEWDEVNAY